APPRRWYCASGRVGSRQLIGERAGEGESPSAFSLFVYRTRNPRSYPKDGGADETVGKLSDYYDKENDL
ncbi:hypothetical protein, partial [Barnesiella intestinihominis]|uniref:hypothetical protein n=1 Tax=Barnesiella intestinihominis TaxID=487174 RepID=UPI003A92CDEF